MILYIKANGKTVRDMVEVNKFGQMAPCMKVIGDKMERMEKDA